MLKHICLYLQYFQFACQSSYHHATSLCIETRSRYVLMHPWPHWFCGILFVSPYWSHDQSLENTVLMDVDQFLRPSLSNGRFDFNRSKFSSIFKKDNDHSTAAVLLLSGRAE